jgi:hypothetical protein
MRLATRKCLAMPCRPRPHPGIRLSLPPPPHKRLHLHPSPHPRLPLHLTLLPPLRLPPLLHLRRPGNDAPARALAERAEGRVAHHQLRGDELR